jgi:hypothetical protein
VSGEPVRDDLHVRPTTLVHLVDTEMTAKKKPNRRTAEPRPPRQAQSRARKRA